MSDPALSPNHRLLTHRPDTRDMVHIRLFGLDTLTIPAHSWNTQNVQSPFWRFYWNTDSGAYIVLNNKVRFPFEPNRIYFVPSGVRFSCGNDTSFRHFYIHFDVIGLSRLTMQSLLGGPVVLPQDVSFSAQVASFADAIGKATDLDIALQCRAKSLVYEGIARYLTALTAESRAKVQHESANREVIAPALFAIEENLAFPLTISYLAGLCCLSPDYFARRFKAVLGQTPNDYLREQRVTQAAQRLLFSEDSLETIAADCGFGSRHYLTRVFTEIMGMPPIRYRKGTGG